MPRNWSQSTYVPALGSMARRFIRESMWALSGSVSIGISLPIPIPDIPLIPATDPAGTGWT
jgi:hypothetical protein